MSNPPPNFPCDIDLFSTPFTDQVATACTSAQNIASVFSSDGIFPDTFESVPCQAIIAYVRNTADSLLRAPSSTTIPQAIQTDLAQASQLIADLTVRYCLNPSAINSRTLRKSGIMSMFDYPIFTSQVCEALVSDSIWSIDQTVQATIHSGLSAFCQQSTNQAIPFYKYLAPSQFTKIITSGAISARGGTTTDEQPRWSLWGYDSASTVSSGGANWPSIFIGTDNIDAMQSTIVLQNTTTPQPDPSSNAIGPDYDNINVVSPNMSNRTVTLVMRKDSPVMTSTTPPIRYADLFTNIQPYIQYGLYITIRGENNAGNAPIYPGKQFAENILVTNKIQNVPILYGKIDHINSADIGLIYIHLTNVRTNTYWIYAQPYASSLGCGFKSTAGPVVPWCRITTPPYPPNVDGNKDENTTQIPGDTSNPRKTVPCRYRWEKIPPPVKVDDDTHTMQGASIGKFSIFVFADSSKTTLPYASNFDPLLTQHQAIDHSSSGPFLLSLCACHLATPVYMTYVSDVISRIPSATRAAPNKDIAQCLFPGCGASDYPAANMVTQPPVLHENTCDIPVCIQSVNIDNSGAIIVDGPFQVSMACNSVQESDTQITELQNELNQLSTRNTVIVGGAVIGITVFLMVIVLGMAIAIAISTRRQRQQLPL